MYGGDILLLALAQLYTAMTKYANWPTDVKRGVITVLFKGGNKCKKEPSSYRDISLCPTILKVYEKVILTYLYRSCDRRQN